MEIITRDGQRFITVGDTVSVPIGECVLDMIEAVKEMTPAQHELIIRDAQLEFPSYMPDKNGDGQPVQGLRMITAMSLVQNQWYAATALDGRVPDRILENHAARLKTFTDAAVHATQHPPVPPVPKPPKEPKEPRVPASVGRAPKQPRTVTFKLGASQAEIKKSRWKLVYDTAVAVNAKNEGLGVTQEQLVEAALAAGFTTPDKNVPYAIRWIALQLVKTDHLFIDGTQSTMPVTDVGA